MYCRKCGERIDQNYDFCPKCGIRIEPNYNDRFDRGRNSYDRHSMDYDYENREGSKDKILYITLGVVVVVLLVGVIWGAMTFLNLKKTETQSVATSTTESASAITRAPEQDTTAQEVTQLPTQEAVVTQAPTVEATQAPTQVPVTQIPVTQVPTVVPQQPVTSGADYIFADSQTRLLSVSELTGLTAWELKVARNEIYARHGRLFNSAELQNYFNGKSWYYGYISPESFDNGGYLSKTELKNAKLITDYEAALGINQN